ncbi:MAG: hypothetical protein WCA46_17095, partial [Actinocatenispora sp.]
MRAGRWTRAGVSALAVVTIGLAGCEHTAAADTSGVVRIDVSRSVCGRGWSHPHGGTRTFRVHNVDTGTTDVRLVHPGTRAVYAELEGLAGGATASLRVRLARGRYAFRCLPEDNDALMGDTVTVTDGPRHGAAPVAPVSEQDLRAAIGTYRAYVQRSLRPLRRDVAALD